MWHFAYDSARTRGWPKDSWRDDPLPLVDAPVRRRVTVVRRRAIRYDGCMPDYLIVPTVLITLALVFYSAGVWSERLQRNLKPWHLTAFWLGLVFDATGTYSMDLLLPGWKWDFHTFTGLAAFLLMLIHAIWATWVLKRGSEEARTNFHRYSMLVWLLWLVPYLGGMFAGMGVGR